jgi:hypothetical protein
MPKRTRTRRPRKAKLRLSRFGASNNKTNHLMSKIYSYKFRLPPQFLLNAQAVPGTISYGGAGAGSKPLSSSNVLVYPSLSGLPNLYDIAFSVNHNLSDLANVGAYAAMYDAYKIGRINLRLQWMQNVSQSTGAPGVLPTVYHYYDQDDIAIPPSTTSISGKQGVVIRQFGNKMKSSLNFSYVPIPAQTVFGSNAIVPKDRQWLNCSFQNIPHNALKVYIADVFLPGGTTQNGFRLQWEYNMQFRAPVNAA